MCYWIVFALFYNFGFEGNFRRPRGLVFKGAIFIEGFFWVTSLRGLFSKVYGIL